MGQIKHPKIPPSLSSTNKNGRMDVWWRTDGLIHDNFLNSENNITAEIHYREFDKMYEKLQIFRRRLVTKSRAIILLWQRSTTHFT